MAALDLQIASFRGGVATVTVTFDDATGVVSNVACVNAGGPIQITITQPGKADIVVTKPGNTTWSQAVNPALGYNINSSCGFQVTWPSS
jgi:hypothetical protein